ncbi:BspA family leucine-rich repeat surface protein, partial [Acinetobacter baumannii]
VSFTDNNGKFHKKGYKPKDKDTLEKLLERMIEVRGDEGDFNDIDTSDIESMISLFNYKSTFNGDITGWNVSKVTDMSSMFAYAISFNQPIGN